MADGSYTWERLSAHLSQSEAYGAYSRSRIPRAPCGRFGHVSALLDGALLLYGGSDGGYSHTNREDYRPGHDFNELWRFDLTNLTWSFLRPFGGGPGKRHMAGAAAVLGKFVLYGGMGRDRGDVWSYSPVDDRWEMLLDEVTVENGGPGSRCGHAMLPWITGQAVGFIVYGGQSQQADGTYMVRDDAWFFDIAARQWRKLRPAPQVEADGGAAVTPVGHFYQAAMTTPLTLPPSAIAAALAGSKKACTDLSKTGHSSTSASSTTCDPSPQDANAARAPAAGTAPVRLRVGVVAGGSTTTPGLTCSSQVWAFTTDCSVTQIIWARLPDLPIALYDTRGAAVGGAAYVFGGHLCHLDQPPRPSYQYYYVNEALRFDLGLGLDQNFDLGRDQSFGSGLNSDLGVAALLRGGVGETDGAMACALSHRGGQRERQETRTNDEL
ncbi:hypothetical protein Vafri_15716 [Volvox africanus]|nr:hypothetical protein Vafri_15716 [Volvox africanus]